MRLAKIERRAFHGFQFSRWNERRVHGSHAGSIDLKHRSQNIAVSLARQVEIRMVGKVEDRILIGGRGIFKSQSAPPPRIPPPCSERGRETLNSILTYWRLFPS